jgi:curved DNA-binding protein
LRIASELGDANLFGDFNMQVNNRREHRRNSSSTYSICWQRQLGEMASAEVQSVDLSNLGIRINCPVELNPGTTVFIECQGTQTRGYCTVRHCTRLGETYSIGLEFDQETRTTLPGSNSTIHDIDYYEFLQISPKAEGPTIQRIYRFMASRFHPDNPVTGDPEKFLVLKHAYEVLSDPVRRAEYDATREARETRPNPIFEMSEFVNGIEGEVNRRLGVMSLLYATRRANPENPRVSLYDLEKRMGWPREYLDFTTWYLRSMQYITREDNSDFALTALGVDYVESNYTKIPILNKLLNCGARTTTSAASRDERRYADSSPELLLSPVAPVAADAGHRPCEETY